VRAPPAFRARGALKGRKIVARPAHGRPRPLPQQMRKSLIFCMSEGSMGFSRRQVVAGLAGLGVVGLAGGGARYWLGRPQDVTTHDYELIAAPLDVELVPGFRTQAWAYGGQVPGVELRCRQGERLRVRFINRLSEPTTIHWHGLRVPLEMDGVPYLSQ